jgi:DNA-binding transcriptional LysR family regulator
VTDSAAVLDQVEHAKADLGLVGKKREGPHLEFRTFACDEMVLVVPADHAWQKRRRLGLDELCRQPLILREVGSGSRWCLEQALARAGKSVGDLQVVLELGSNEGIKEAVLGGIGVALLSTRAVAREVKSGRLRALRVTGLKLERDLFAVRDRRRALSIPARLFIDFLAPCPHARPGHKQRL